MRQTTIIIFLLFMLFSPVAGQQCISVSFDSQEDVDQFPSMYPGCHYVSDLFIWGESIINLDSLYPVDSVTVLRVWGSGITDFKGLGNLKFLGDLHVDGNRNLKNFSGLDSLRELSNLVIQQNDSLETIGSFNNIDSIWGIGIYGNPLLLEINGFNNLRAVDVLAIQFNDTLKIIDEFNQVEAISDLFFIEYNKNLETVTGFQNVRFWDYHDYLKISIINNVSLKNIAPFPKSEKTNPDENYFEISIENNALSSLDFLDSIDMKNGSINVKDEPNLINLNGLNNFEYVDFFNLQNLWVSDLADFSNLKTIGYELKIINCDSLKGLEGLYNCTFSSDYFSAVITNNDNLSYCSIPPVCNLLKSFDPLKTIIGENAPGCGTHYEIIDACGGISVDVSVLQSANCQPVSPTGIENILVHLSNGISDIWRPTNSNGTISLAFYDTTNFFLNLPQFPTEYTTVCQDTFFYNSDTITGPVEAVFLLEPTNTCPKLQCEIEMPSFFRGCNWSSSLNVLNKNVGGDLALNTRIGIKLPPELTVVSSFPTITAIVNDTLFFDTGDLLPFQTKKVQMTVKTVCEGLLPGQSICLESFSYLDNPCPENIVSSDVRVFSECIGDSIARFTLRNILSGMTVAAHDYIISEDEIVLKMDDFILGPFGEMIIDVPANNGTYRIEATQLDDGTRSSIALEGCGGFSPGFVTAYWISTYVSDYDYDCRELNLSWDPNQKSAIPKGIGNEHIIPANIPITYTVDFQNTGNDTAVNVQILDILPAEMDVASFRMGNSSHAFTWEIRGMDSLFVRFLNIMLPDSNISEPNSHGWFSYTINQHPDLPVGTIINNKAQIYFDFNPAVITNTTYHKIGQPLTGITNGVIDPQQQNSQWLVLGNPVKDKITLVNNRHVEGTKIFSLFNASGSTIVTNIFDGQRVDFIRRDLPSGWYGFTITHQSGEVFQGKLSLD